MLKLALESIAKQNMSQQCFETIVVDNGSTDETKEVVDSFVKIIPNLRYFYEETPGLHVGRHKGLKEARSDILVYADDDIEAFPTWLEGIEEAFEDKDVALVGGKNLPKFEIESPDWIMKMWLQAHPEGKILGYLSILDFGDSIKEINPYYVFGCNFSIRKAVLQTAGGFHPDGMPKKLIRFRGDGETHVSKYIKDNGIKCLFHPGASVFHKVTPERMTFTYFRQRAFNQGISDSYTSLRQIHLLGKNSNQIKTGPIRQIVWAIKRFLKNALPVDDDRKFLNNEIALGYQDGFDYHQHAFATDPEVRDWVLKQNYIEESLS